MNKLNVLLIEDNLIIQKMHKLMLENLNCEVTVASNGQQAINSINKDHSLVFVDLGLPDISGADVIKEIQNENKKKVTIIVWTALNLKEAKELCKNVLVDYFLTKPTRESELKEIFKNLGLNK